MPGVEVFNRHTERYDQWFERHPEQYEAELRALSALLPRVNRGLEIGVGTGRFSVPLGIRWGVDPSIRMGKMAKSRGIQVISARAEGLPFKAFQFDLVLLVTTLCFLNDPGAALKEVYRVLISGGTILIGTFDPDSPPGVPFIRENKGSPFFQEARFYSVESVAALMRSTGFNQFEYRQTLRQVVALPAQVQTAEEGYGQGLFVVIKARKM
jgi:SAM-dependent methyltransferase